MQLVCCRFGSRNVSICSCLLLLLLYASRCHGGETDTATAAERDSAMAHSKQEPAATAPQRSLRLPNATYPLHYHLHIATHIHRAQFEYDGNVTIDIQIRQSTNEIVLLAKNLSDFAIALRELNTGEPMEDIAHTYDAHANFLVIHPRENYQAFEAGQLYRVEILFKGHMNEDTFGVYWMTYGDEQQGTVYVAATQFEPTSARLAFPCYDEPSFKANFTIRLTHSHNYSAISNMQVLQVDAASDASTADDLMVTTTFLTTPLMSTYLVAFVISNFEYISVEYRGVTQRIFTSPGIADKGHKALNNAVRTVAALEDYFGIDYPLMKLDHIALKKNYGAAMENWGLITYKEDHLVHQDHADHADMHEMLKDVLTQSHEIAHQWFGNLVSPQWWTYAWLNEGFATYFGYLVTDLLHPDLKAMDFFLTDIAERAYSYNYMTVRPMTFYVEKETEIMSVFDIISYQRAACVIKMFHHAFNQKTFVRGISRYLSKFQYTVANELDLFDSLQAAIAEDDTLNTHAWSDASTVRDIMLSWTHSEWIPIVIITRDYEANTVTIRQRSKDANSQEHWWIPLNFASASTPNFARTRVDYFMPPVPEVTLGAHELGIELRVDDWLIANKQQTGFYHMLYNDPNLWLIAKQLHDNHTLIHPLNRAAIFQDLLPLIENNEIQSVDVVFELLKYLQYEEDLIPWNQVADTIEFLWKNLYGTMSHNLYNRFVRQLTRPMFLKLFQASHNVSNMDTETLARRKFMEMACMADLKECLNYTHTLARDHILGNMKLINDRDYYATSETILCLGVKYLSDDEFSAILDMLAKAERDSFWYDDLIYSLRCTQSHSHLRLYLNFLLGENSTKSIMNDSESMMYLFYLFKSNLAARPVMWHFLEHNYRTLCRSDFFIENFNRIAEYIPQLHHREFLRLRNIIATELDATQSQSGPLLIGNDSFRIGKKMRISEAFLEKFDQRIYEWLQHDQQPSMLAAAVGARSSAIQIGHLFRVAGKFLRKLVPTTKKG